MFAWSFTLFDVSLDMYICVCALRFSKNYFYFMIEIPRRLTLHFIFLVFLLTVKLVYYRE